MHIELSEHFTYSKLLRFTFPSIIMMVLNSIYGVVDGFFISNFIGAEPFAAVNIVMPFLMIFGAVGFMIGTGGSALVAYTLGVGDKKKANEIFSLLVYLLVGLGLLLTVIGEIFVGPISQFLGADAEMLPYCVTYGRILMIALVPFMLQNVFQSFLVTAERPQLGLVTTLVSSVLNIVLDALFIAVFRWGVAGAASATALSQTIGGIVPLTFFIMSRSSKLRLGKTHMDLRAITKACTNGASEFMTNVSMSIVPRLYNSQLMRLRLPLWRRKQRRTEESLQKKPQDHSGHEHSSDHSGRTSGKTAVDDLCKLRYGTFGNDNLCICRIFHFLLCFRV